ncbi:NUMOD3 domain-containing DNA-binding protein, partial [Streptomyces caeruleatus]
DVSDLDWIARERYWIKLARQLYGRSIILNITDGGDLTSGVPGRKFSEEHKRKLSESNKGKHNNPDQIERLRILNTGRKLTEKQRENIRKNL